MSLRTSRRAALAALAVSGLLLAATGPILAQDAPPLGFSDVAEVTVVMTNGNATSTTLGLKNTAIQRWASSSLEFVAGAVRASSGITTRTATGTPENFTVIEETNSEKTAENYFAKARYDRAIGEAAFAFGGAGWDRNTFAGIQNRYAFVLGVGRTWFDGEDRRLKTDLGATYTIQDDVVPAPDANDAFLGARATIDYFRTLSGTTSYTSVLVVDENLDATDDLRADWTNAITVSMSERLALKASYQLLFDNLPSLTSVPLDDTTVQVPLEKTDGTLTLAVVVDF